MATNSLRLNSSAAALAAAALIWIPSAASSVGTAPSSAGARKLNVPILMYHRIDYLRAGLPPMTRYSAIARFPGSRSWSPSTTAIATF